MSYSPTVYSASIVTPSALASALRGRRRRRRFHPRHSARHRHRPHDHAWVGVEILDQARRTVGVDLLEQFAIADMHLPLLQHDRHRHHQRELRRLALVVVHQADDGLVVMMRDHDLRRVIDQRAVGLADVEAAERARVTRRARESAPRASPSENLDLLNELQKHGHLHFVSIRICARAKSRPTAERMAAAINKAQMSPLVW